MQWDRVGYLCLSLIFGGTAYVLFHLCVFDGRHANGDEISNAGVFFLSWISALSLLISLLFFWRTFTKED